MAAPGDMDVNGDLIGHDLEPGTECPECRRRIPHPKKPTSPKTKPKAYRVPVEEREAHEDVLAQAAKHLGTHERPHWEFQTYTIALALVLQDEKLRGFASRRAA